MGAGGTHENPTDNVWVNAHSFQPSYRCRRTAFHNIFRHSYIRGYGAYWAQRAFLDEQLCGGVAASKLQSLATEMIGNLYDRIAIIHYSQLASKMRLLAGSDISGVGSS